MLIMSDANLELMAHLMRRAGFGASRDELERRTEVGYSATVDELLHPERQEPIDLYEFLRYYPLWWKPGTMGGIPPAAEVEVAIQRVLRACLAQGVPCAITTGAGSVEQRMNEGFRFVTVGFDGGISGGVTTALQRGRAAAGR